MHDAVARGTFGRENAKSTSGSDHFLRIRLPFDVVKVRAVVARSTFGSQKCKQLRAFSLSSCVKLLV